MRSTLLSGAACCALASLAALPERADEAEQLLAADRAFYVSTTAEGLDGWLGWFAPDAVALTPTGERVTGADALRTHYGVDGFPPPGFRWEPQSAGLADSGDLGYTIGTWELQPPGDDAAVPSGRYLSIWKRQPDGEYRVLVDAGGNTDFRTQLEQVEGPPLAWSSNTDWSATAESGELSIALGSWSARLAGTTRNGRFLSVWQRSAGSTWEIVTEIGFEVP